MANIPQDIYDIKGMLDTMLGDSKQELDSSLQLEYPCPRCIEKYGVMEAPKHNLSISLEKMKYNCWKCSSEGDGDMMGNLSKLFRLYGSEDMLSSYLSKVMSLKSSGLYTIHTSDGKPVEAIEEEALKLPNGYIAFEEGGKNDRSALSYLTNRGIDWDIIKRYNIGYTRYCNDTKKNSFRIILPSYDVYGNLNYWVGRDYLPDGKRVKYMNPKVEKRDIIFNEKLVQWDADITLVEGPFDHIVVPNSIPLLGKSLNNRYKLYWELLERANANINIMLDGDAYDTVVEIYKFLNHGRLYNRIRYIPMEENEDPSSVFQEEGYEGIMKKLLNYKTIEEVYLQ